VVAGGLRCEHVTAPGLRLPPKVPWKIRHDDGGPQPITSLTHTAPSSRHAIPPVTTPSTPAKTPRAAHR
jgi:hypothetical protein